MTDRLQSGGLLATERDVTSLDAAGAAVRPPVTIPYRANLLGNIEQALKGLQGFGIMALELIQNADDAAAGSLSFDARDDALVIANDGSFTSCGLGDVECPWIIAGDPSGSRRPCNFHAITEMGSRSKLRAAEQIGRFGIGFVSVYQVTDTPVVRSSGVELRLNPQTQEVVKSDIGTIVGTEFILPWASADSEVRRGLNASPTPVDVADRVVAEIERVLQGSLLFLRHLQSVELRRSGKLVAAVAIARSTEQVTLRFDPSGDEQRWLLLSRSAEDVVAGAKLLDRFEALRRLHRSMTVSVAVPINLEQVEGLLYAYLPTRQPTRMPVHVNADFFPHASRQAVVLEGEQHERYWNEALISTAAAALADNFVRIRDLLGPTRLWALAEAAFQRKAEPAFEPFWKRLGKAAAAAPSVWTTRGEWRSPRETALPPEPMRTIEQAAVADLGIALIHPELRRHWTVLSSIGAQQLRLSSLVTALEARGADATAGGGEALRRLWSAIELLVDAPIERVGLSATLARLKAVPFLLDVHDGAVSPLTARRLPNGVSAPALGQVAPRRRVVHPDVLSLPCLSGLVAEYLLDDLAADLAGSITDEASAVVAIGDSDADARRFYALLTSFPTDRGTGSVATALANVPVLRTGTGFASPSRGQLPGDFRDPIGHFQIVETRLFVPGMGDFARGILRVRVLTFRDYVVDHLEEIVTTGVTQQQYGALMAEIVSHRSQLDADSALKELARIAFIRTRAGKYARPHEAYFWSAQLASILGDDRSRWVDEAWLPTAILPRARDLLEGLGMPSTVSAKHIVERISAVAAKGTIDEIVAGTTPVVRHVLERWTRYNDEDRLTLGRLRDVHFLAAIVDGKREAGSRYLPRSVYRAGRATGFGSQVPVVEMAALRQANAVVTEFLDLVGMPTEPSTDKVVAHLEHCMASGAAVNDLTYQILSERLERSDDAATIDRLAGTDFIHVPEVGFIGAGEVFWMTPPFRGRWLAAGPRMRQREQLYRRLGVVDSPEPRHFAALALQVAGAGSPSPEDRTIHGRCLAALAEALDRGDAGAAEAVDLLGDERAFLAVNGDATWTSDAIWLDSEQLAAPFGSVLDDRLVRLTDVGRPAALRLLRRLDVRALSDVARFSLAEDPAGTLAGEATSLLRSRADLLLWLAPNRTTRQALRDILRGLEIRCSDRLLVQAEIDVFDPPVRTPASSADAYVDPGAGLLHLRSTTGRVDWVVAFRALFAEVERFCPSADVPPLCLTAAYIMSMQDRADAEQALRASDIKAPSDDDGIEAGRDLWDEPMAGAEGFGNESLGEAPVAGEAAGGAGPLEDDEQSDAPVSNGRVGAELERNDGADRPAVTDPRGLTDPGELDSGGTSGTVGEEAADDEVGDEEYGSASSRGKFGGDPADTPAGAASVHRGPEDGSKSAAGSPRGRAARFGAGGVGTGAERQVRRSRMLAYVSRGVARGSGDAERSPAGDDVGGLIDAAAMGAVLSHEQARGWVPEQQPHLNPGFDVISRSPGGERRLIEVKGLEHEWTERGVKLSHVQFSMAREHPDEFWIYVVEHARDAERRRVTAIRNPFGKVEEYWFDHNWREASEEAAASRGVHLRVGLRVEHPMWGEGAVVEVKSRGAIPLVVVDFGDVEGQRSVPLNSSLRVVG